MLPPQNGRRQMNKSMGKRKHNKQRFTELKMQDESDDYSLL